MDKNAEEEEALDGHSFQLDNNSAATVTVGLEEAYQDGGPQCVLESTSELDELRQGRSEIETQETQEVAVAGGEGLIDQERDSPVELGEPGFGGGDGESRVSSTSVVVEEGSLAGRQQEKDGEKKVIVDGDESLGPPVPAAQMFSGEEEAEIARDGEKREDVYGENGLIDREDDLTQDMEAVDPAVVDVAKETTAEVREMAEVAEDRGIAEEKNVADGVVIPPEEKEDSDELKEREIGDKDATDMVEESGVPSEKEVVDMAERSELAGVGDGEEIMEGTVIPPEEKEDTDELKEKEIEDKDATDMVEENGVPSEKEVVGMAEQAELAGVGDGVEIMEGTVITVEEKEETDKLKAREIEDKEATDMVDENGVPSEKEVVDAAEQADMAVTADRGEMMEETEKSEETGMPKRIETSEMGSADVETEEEAHMEGTAVMTDRVDAIETQEETDMVDEVERTETQEETALADIDEGIETAEEMDETENMEVQEEFMITDAADTIETVGEEEGAEGMEEVDEASKTIGGKRKRGKNVRASAIRGATRKKVEEDVCFICFDGGDLFLCDRRGCPKAYHPACVGRDEAFFRARGKWNCGWHLCSKCEKNAHYMCYTCTFSLCKGCIKDAVILCVRGNKGFCETCLDTVMMIEKNEQEKKETAQVDFDDKSSWEYLFKDYWIDLKARESINLEELSQAKNPWKGSELRANKHEWAEDDDTANDGGSCSDSSSRNAEKTISKGRKTRRGLRSDAREGSAPSRATTVLKGVPKGEKVEWASKELLEVVMHMRNGDKSFLPQSEVHNLLLEYIKKYNLRDPRRKSQVICDSRLQTLFGKPHVGHFEMLNLLDSHFLVKEDSQADELQESVVDTEANHLEADDSPDALVKRGKDKKRKTRKKSDDRGRQSNLDDYAAIDNHNINLIYLRRNLVEELIEDIETFHDKVVGSFVRIRISGSSQKQDLYRLVQVVGTSKATQPYKVGKKTTDFLLEILNLNKTEVISIDIISNQEFTEDECKRLRQSIKCGLINRLTVGDIQEKAISIQEVRVKDWLETEIMRLSHLRDRASEKGRRKDWNLLERTLDLLGLRECVEKLQLLKSPDERRRRLEEIPEIHADPNMDPNYESEEEDEADDKKQDSFMRPRGSGLSRRGREPVSPRRGGFSASNSWSGTRNYSNMNRELSRNMSSKGFPNKIDDAIGSGEIVDENLWNLGRDKETQQSINWQKPKSTSISESGSGSIHAVVVSEPSSKLVSEISSAPASAGVSQPAAQISETEKMWYYQDPSGKVQGPFSMVQLRKWSNTGYFPTDLKIWKTAEKQDDSILLTDALAGKFQKDPLGACSFTKAQITSHSGMPHGAAVQQGVEGSGGERLKFDQTRAPWNPQGNLVSSSQPMLESWKSQPEMSSSTGSAAPLSLEIFEIPKYSQEPWSSETNLPSPTPNQTTAPTKRRTFESRWSPTPAQPSASLPVASHFPGGGGSQAPAVVSESGQLTHSSTPQSSLKVGGGVNGSSSSHGASPAPNNMLLSPTAPQAHSQPAMTGESQGVQANPHRLPVLDSPGALTNPSGSVPRVEVTALPPTPTSGSQHWGNASSLPAQPPAYGHWVNASSSSQNSASTFSTVNPAVVFPSQSQPGFPPSDSWRLPVPSQSTVQAPVPLPNLPWGVGITDNQSNVPRQGPENQNSGWGPMPGNPNISWGPIPTNTNMNWGPSGPGPSQGNPNSGWVAPIQGQAHGNANPGWAVPGQGQNSGNAIAGWMPPGQGPAHINGNPGWVGPGQGATPGNANPGWAPQSGNQGLRGNEQNQNGDRLSNQRDRGSQAGDSSHDGGKPWNRQSSFGSGGGGGGGSGGSSRPPFKGHRVCKYYRETGHCKKGASCDFPHT